MAGNSIYRDRRPMMVKPLTAATFNYGFLTNIEASVSTDLGQVEATGANVVFGANAPKPGRATKRDTTGVNSSFYDISRRNTLKTLGYRLTAPRVRSGRKTRFTETVYITINGVKYAWQMTDRQRAKIGADFDALGLRTGTNADKDLVFGASRIGNAKPGKAQKVELGVDGEDVITTFYDPSVTLPESWGAVLAREYGA